MLRMALEYVQPGMILGRDIYEMDGKVILIAGVTLTEKHLEVLKKRGIMSLYIIDPFISLPPIEEVVAEATRLKAAEVMRKTFQKVTKQGLFELTEEQRKLIKAVILQVLDKRLTIIHMAQIHRHHDDLFAHSINVAILSLMTAVTMGISNSEELYNLSTGALLHDIGMNFVPPQILAKGDNLSAEEQEIYESHAAFGFEILRKTEGFPLVAAHMAFQHHEKYNGEGYPRRLAGDDINKLARIVAIADAYDKMVADRPEQKSLPPHLAYEAIVAGVTSSFDPVVAKAFLSKIALYPAGTMVKLTNGQIGVVIKATPQMQHRPLLKIIAGADEALLPEPYHLDLADRSNLTVFIQDVVSDSAAAEFLNKNRDKHNKTP